MSVGAEVLAAGLVGDLAQQRLVDRDLHLHELAAAVAAVDADRRDAVGAGADRVDLDARLHRVVDRGVLVDVVDVRLAVGEQDDDLAARLEVGEPLDRELEARADRGAVLVLGARSRAGARR